MLCLALVQQPYRGGRHALGPARMLKAPRAKLSSYHITSNTSLRLMSHPITERGMFKASGEARLYDLPLPIGPLPIGTLRPYRQPPQIPSPLFLLFLLCTRGGILCDDHTHTHTHTQERVRDLYTHMREREIYIYSHAQPLQTCLSSVCLSTSHAQPLLTCLSSVCLSISPTFLPSVSRSIVSPPTPEPSETRLEQHADTYV